MSFSTRVFSDDKKFEKGGIWSNDLDDIAKNFPACILSYHEDDLSADGITWSSRAGNFTLKSSNNFSFIKNSLGVSGATSTFEGSLPVIGDLNPFLISVGTMDSGQNNITIGDEADGTTPTMRLKGGANGDVARIKDTNEVVTGTLAAVTYPLTGAMAVSVLRASNDVVKVAADNIGVYSESVLKASSIGTIDGTWGAFVDIMSIIPLVTGGSKLIALFAFKNPLSVGEADTANLWMAANPGKFYPGFAGKL